MRSTRTSTAPLDFFTLARIDDLPELQAEREAVEEIGQHIRHLDQTIPQAAERFSALWKGFNSTTTSFAGGLAEAPEVVEARATVEELQRQAKVLQNNAALARMELELAKSQLLEKLRPAMVEQLGEPIRALIRGYEAILSVERLCGTVAGHEPARRSIWFLLDYFKAVETQLVGRE